jgi:hypothetical protein
MGIDLAHARDIFMAAVQKCDGKVRVAFLDDAFCSNEVIRHHVDLLLVAHPQAGTFLDKGAVAKQTVDLPKTEKSGQIIGP